ncbi:MAG: cell division protein FtsQ/DivIB [Bacillota bacterium]
MDKSKLGILMILLIIIGLVSFLNSNYFIVEEVHIKGNDSLSDKFIVEYSNLDREINIFNVEQEELANQLVDLPQVKGAVVKRSLPRKIYIEIQERVPIAIVSNKSSYLVIDKEAWILDKIDNLNDTKLPLFVDQDLVIKQNKVELTAESELAVNYLSKLSEQLLKEVKEFKIASSQNVELILREGGQVNLGKDFAIDKKAQVFNKIYADLQQKGVKVEHINLEHNQNVFIKTKK